MTNTTLPEENYDYQQDPKVKEKWKKRFVFVEEMSKCSSPQERREKFKKHPFMERIMLQMSFLAFFFGPIYLLILGLWKKAIVCFVVSFIIAVIGAMIGVRFFNLFFNIFVSFRAISWYYEFKVKNKHTWSL